MISLGRDLIASMDGQAYPLRRVLSGSYVDGIWVEDPFIPVNQTIPINFNDSSSQIAAKLNDVFGGGLISVSGSIVVDEELEVTWTGDSDDHPEIVVVSNSLTGDETDPVGITIETIQEGGETNERQTITFNNPDGTIVAGTFVLSIGEPIPITTPTEVFASVQPLTGEDLIRLPEGDRTKTLKKAYSADLLKTSDKVTGAAADIVTVGGVDFEVNSVEEWNGYWKAILIKIVSPGS